MKWPLVWRSTLDAAQGEWGKLHDDMRERYVGHERRAQELTRQALELVKQRDTAYDTLLEKYHSLRVSGANTQPVGLPVATRSRKAADLAIESMVEKYPHFRGLGRRLQMFVHTERQRPNADEDRIARMVVEWPTDEDSD